MSVSETSLCNMSLGRIGAKRINDIGDAADTKPEAVQCRLHYEQTRDALLRSHWWRFASARATLARDVPTPDFEWDYQFSLPNNFLRMKKPYEGYSSAYPLIYTYELEGKKLLTNETTMEIKYIRKVTDVTEFDPLFVEVLILALAIKLSMPLSKDNKMRTELKEEIKSLMKDVRTVDFQETNTVGSSDMQTWKSARI